MAKSNILKLMISSNLCHFLTFYYLGNYFKTFRKILQAVSNHNFGFGSG